MRQKKPLTIQEAWAESFYKLTDEEAGRLIKAIFRFMDGKKVELEDAKLDKIFCRMAEQIIMFVRPDLKRPQRENKK